MCWFPLDRRTVQHGHLETLKFLAAEAQTGGEEGGLGTCIGERVTSLMLHLAAEFGREKTKPSSSHTLDASVFAQLLLSFLGQPIRFSRLLQLRFFTARLTAELVTTCFTFSNCSPNSTRVDIHQCMCTCHEECLVKLARFQILTRPTLPFLRLTDTIDARPRCRDCSLPCGRSVGRCRRGYGSRHDSSTLRC